MTTSHSAYLKIKRAKKHIADANALLSERRPYSYALWTEKVTGQRSVGTKTDKAALNDLALACGDAVHNLRAALDHATWSIVSPFCSSDKERQNVQFPFARSKDTLGGTIKNRQIDLAPPKVRAEIEALQPYDGGNKLLYLIYELDNLDKHKLLVPTGDYKAFSGAGLRLQVPDVPLAMVGHMHFGGNYRDIVWTVPGFSAEFLVGTIDRPVADTGTEYEQELDIPVHIIFAHGAPYEMYPVIPTLHALVDVAADVVERLLAAAGENPTV